MSDQNVLVAHFPRAAMGYAQNAVDDFVRQIGERLEEMQVRIDELTEQNEGLKKQAGSAKREPQADTQREVALANAMLAIEQRKMAVEVELQGLKDQTQREAEAAKESARREVEGTKEAARLETDGMREAARREAEGVRAAAQAEAAQILGRAKLAAEEMMDAAVTATTAEEERLQGLCLQYDHTVDEIRRVLEMQLSLLPAVRTLDLSHTTQVPAQGSNFASAYDDEFGQRSFATDGAMAAA